MNYRSTIATFALAAACLLSTTRIHSSNNKPLLTPPQMVVLGGLISCGYLLFHREPVKGFVPRYSFKKVTEIKSIVSKEYFNNLWYIFYDGFIGQKGKARKDAHGVLGITAYYLAPLKKAGGTVAFAYGLYCIGLKLDKQIANLAKHKNKNEEPKVKPAVQD